MQIKITEPKFDRDWFKHRSLEALKIFESRRDKTSQDRYLDVLGGLYEHSYKKGRHDAESELKSQYNLLKRFEEKIDG